MFHILVPDEQHNTERPSDLPGTAYVISPAATHYEQLIIHAPQIAVVYQELAIAADVNESNSDYEKLSVAAQTVKDVYQELHSNT